MRRMQQRPKTHLEVGDSSDADNFQSNMRRFNSALALSSMGAQVEEFRDYGPYSYKIHEQIYLAAGPLHPSTAKALSYGQLYLLYGQGGCTVQQQTVGWQYASCVYFIFR
uniref:Uncharacterized protein n=1 Tax=Caenorhabditis japonica TaxID=281687 RepID=A0A8R1IDY5_CAEJA